MLIDFEDACDLQLQRELQQAFELYLNASGPEKRQAKADYEERLRAFTARC